MADMALAAYSGAADILTRVNQIIDKAGALNNQCEEIRYIVSLLSDILQKNPSSIRDSRVISKLRDVLDDAELCVNNCERSRTNKALEVFWRDSLPRVTKSLLVWTTYLTAENNLDSKAGILQLLDENRQQIDRTDQYRLEIIDKLKILDDIRKNQEDLAANKDAPVDFETGDPRFQILTATGDKLTGTLQISESISVPVVCDEVRESLIRSGEKGPRHVAIYSRLSARTGVHPFYGIARHGKKRWFVFQDLRDSPCLAQALSNESNLQNVLDRVKLAADVATTIAYMHSVEILLKNLTDQTVLLVKEDEQLIPYLTEVEQARQMKERTTGQRYDFRYQAPEVSQIGQHTTQTDIWSLGILIWQCVTRDPPFNMSKKVLEGEKIMEIQEHVQSGQLPWKSDPPDPVYAKVANLVRRCCNNDPRKRPPATAVKDHLIDILQTPTTKQDNSNSNTDDQVLLLLDAVTIQSRPLSECQLSNEQMENLKKRARGGDSTAAYLFGSAVWVGIADLGSDYKHEPIMVVPDSDINSERRARIAIEFLELAIRGDNKQATARLYEAYVKLAKLCKKRLKQDNRALGSHES